MTRKHIGLPRMAALFVVALPGMIVDQARRINAIRKQRSVVYSPRPNGGRPLSELRAELSAKP
jgi:hypothetical protein